MGGKCWRKLLCQQWENGNCTNPFAVAIVTGLAISPLAFGSLFTLSITTQRTAYNKGTLRIEATVSRTQVCTYVLYSTIINFMGGNS